jgi:hypothetical protein
VPIPDLPTFDEFVAELLRKVFGPGATIVAIWLAFSWLLSWQSGYGYGVRFVRFSRRSADAALSLRPISRAFALVSSVAMLVLQAIWIWTCYVAGNVWSHLVNPQGTIVGPDFGYIFGSLHWDTISKVYVGACVLALIAAYADAIGLSSPILVVLWAPILLLAVPNGFFTVFALLVSAFGLAFALLQRLVDGYFHPMDPFIKAMLLILGLGLTHIVTTVMALSTPNMMSNAWKRR